MSVIANSPRASSQLSAAFEGNEFDVAGMADLPTDESSCNEALRELYGLLKRGAHPSRNDPERLARVLLAMLSVARNDYATDGFQEYWPFLFGKIREAAFVDPERFWSHALEGQQHQALLGQWFQTALEEFGYSIPDEGLRYVGPIVFHAGVPRASLRGVLQLVGDACEQYGQQSLNLPADVRLQLVTNHFPPLHRNVARLLESNYRGASQLWTCLARVVLAWQRRGDCSEELRQLPAALDPCEVRQALPQKSIASTPRQARVALPQIRFDPETGEVRLCVPDGRDSDWQVTFAGERIEIQWARTHLGTTAEFKASLPEVIHVARRGGESAIKRDFVTRPAHWPGIWFHGSNGNIEDGATIDASGLDPGRWYVLFEGTPTRWNVPSVRRVQLKWSSFAGHLEWTAWEIEVPSRAQDRPCLDCFVDDNRFHVPLSRRPGPRVECLSEPVATASTISGDTLSVFAAVPTVRVCREHPLPVLLLRERNDDVEIIRQAELPVDQACQLPVASPGVYQLREARGVGRVLMHFAFVPGLKVADPIYDGEMARVSIEISGIDAIGDVVSHSGDPLSIRDGAVRHEQSTVEPFISLEWKWRDESTSPMLFRWRVEGLRWRVLRLSDEAARWTREPIFISPKDVQRSDAQLEIQAPTNRDLQVNSVAYAEQLQRTSTGNSLTLSLLPFGEAVEIAVDDEPSWPAVILSERPILDYFEAFSDGDSVLLNWKAASVQVGTVIVAWNPLEPSAAPVLISISSEQFSAGVRELACSELPGTEWCSLSLARSVRVGFTRNVLHLAASRSQSGSPVAVLLDRSTGTTKSPTGESPTNWAEFLHRLSLDRLNCTYRSATHIAESLNELHSKTAVDLTRLLQLESQLRHTVSTPEQESDRAWRECARHGLTAFARRLLQSDPAHFLELIPSQQFAEWLESVLSAGIPVGQTCPFHWLSSKTDSDTGWAYPFAFIRDLWLLGTSERDVGKQVTPSAGALLTELRAKQRAAASRVWQCAQDMGLSFLPDLLPISQINAWTRETDCRHKHFFALPRRAIDSTEAFADALGLDDLGLDCEATCEDPFWDAPMSLQKGVWHSAAARHVLSEKRHKQQLTYSTYWSCDDQQWFIERVGMSPPTCCRTANQPLLVPPLNVSTVLQKLDIRRLLSGWAELDAASPHVEDLPCYAGLEEKLCSDEVLGTLHREVIIVPKPEVKELFGRIVEVQTKPAIPQRAIVAWRLAWVDRLCAWNGAPRFFESELPTQGNHADFLRALGQACRAWPNLMKRCLALTEIVIWTVCRGGLGVAIRFAMGPESSSDTDCLPHTTALAPQTTNRTSYVNASSKEVAGATGIIVGYDAGDGWLLIKHPSSPSLDDTVKHYVDHKPDYHSWIARFTWRAIAQPDREYLQDMLARGKAKGKHGPETLADLMCGMIVKCELAKAPRWEATSISVDIAGRRFVIPRHRRQPQHS